MAKRKSNKKADKDVTKKTSAKGTAKSAGKKSTARKPKDDKTKAKPRSKPKPQIEIPSDIEPILEQTEGTQTDKPTEGLNEVVVEKLETEISTGKVVDALEDDQSGGVKVPTQETAEDTESLAREVENLQIEEETGNVVGSVIEDHDSEESFIKKVGYTQTDKQVDVSHTEEITDAILDAAAETERLVEEAESNKQEKDDKQEEKPVEDVSEPVIENSVITESSTQAIDDTRIEGQSLEVDETVFEDPYSIESHIEKTEVTQTDEQSDEVIDISNDTEGFEEDVEELLNEDEMTRIVDEDEDPDISEILSQEEVDIQTDMPVDDISESITEDTDTVETEMLLNDVERVETVDEHISNVVEVEDSVDTQNPTEEMDDTKAGDQTVDGNEVSIEDSDSQEVSIEKAEDIQIASQEGEGIEVDDVEETVTGNSVTKGKTFVNRIKKLFSGISRFRSKADDITEEDIESNTEVEGNSDGIEKIQVDKQEGKVVETVFEIPDSTEKADDILTDQKKSVTEEVVESTDNESPSVVYIDNKQYRTKKTGIIISVFIVAAAVVLLIFASVERRSAKKALVEINKVAESLKQIQEETLKGREQVIYSQIESRELVIDSLLITRNGLELEQANSEEVEVKRIIDVFINDIDERARKIKDDILLLKKKIERYRLMFRCKYFSPSRPDSVTTKTSHQ